MGMMGLIVLVHYFFQLLDLLILVGIALSWIDCIRLSGAGWLYSPPLNFIRDLTFRILRPFRKPYNAILNAVGIRPGPVDFSPILALVFFAFLEKLLVTILWRIGGGIG